MTHLLILGGTGEARDLAERLAARPALRITVSLAGRTAAPAPLPGELRTGGFGGPDGLARYLREARVDVLIDATHPFARRISANAEQAAAATGTPLVALERPPWTALSGDRWLRVPDMAAAAAALGDAPRRVFLAVGRQEIASFRAAPPHRYLVRSVEPVDPAAAPPGAEFILARGPFDAPAERQLLAERRIDVLVAKNSGGAATYGKIAAARELALPVVLLDRPARPGAAQTVEEALARIDHWLAPAERGE